MLTNAPGVCYTTLAGNPNPIHYVILVASIGPRGQDLSALFMSVGDDLTMRCHALVHAVSPLRHRPHSDAGWPGVRHL